MVEALPGQPKICLSFDMVMDLCDIAAQHIIKYTNYETVWGIPRNGLIIAGLIAHCDNRLQLRMPDYYGDAVIIDDIHDSGRTLKPCMSVGFYTLTLFWRKKPLGTPSMWIRTIEDNSWIVFPWENVYDEGC